MYHDYVIQHKNTSKGFTNESSNIHHEQTSPWPFVGLWSSTSPQPTILLDPSYRNALQGQSLHP
ncbi:predicted protein [Sclerotinia sclerotiorum 1980 UF-70]|uniref:Uncharacterized protein n=2 Tax=Sclerotinia sclerotiorum (strain ATCC 18683 / 1980 / Ss-1) TaxID=665079 RepID=A7EU81_SCLS1|nr:predicted protein [Sclerotinia sclerotiorum 1980 UF-70]APA15258.1 hypothetical protein sscle_14g100280 [Sclerotinia sclerotiorum 1980 UF-70]EDN93023.1 predicted protein [Sclerotinia sclerotiorum 1980 UF-70]